MQTNETTRHWLNLLVCIALIAFGCVMTYYVHGPGLAFTSFFVFGALMSVEGILRGRRRARRDPDVPLIRANTPLRPSRLRMLFLGGGMLVFGAVTLVYGAHMPRFLRWLAWVSAPAGAWTLIAALDWRLKHEGLEFRADGLVFGKRGWQALLPWDDITGVRWDIHYRNPTLFLNLQTPSAIAVTPPSAQPAFLKYTVRTHDWVGADICVMTGNYDVDVKEMVAAIERYRTEPAARLELASAVMPAGIAG